MGKPRGRIATPAACAKARAHLGLDKKALAKLLRLSPEHGRQTIRRIEQGQPPPGPYQLALEALVDGWRPRGVVLPVDKDPA